MNRQYAYTLSAVAACCTFAVTMPAAAATFSTGDILTITPGVRVFDANGNQTNVTPGSWFGMDTNGNSAIAGQEKTAIGSGPDGGLIIGSLQDTNGHASHGGAVHTGVGGIDAEWGFFGNAGMDFTTVAVNQLTTTPTGGTINLAGWTVTWNSIPVIPMGSGAWDPSAANCTALGIVPPDFACSFTGSSAQVGWNGAYAMVSNTGVVSGGNYNLWYTATVPIGDVSGFGGVKYMLHFEGVVLKSGTHALADTVATITGSAVSANVLANDIATTGLNKTTVAITQQPSGGASAVANANGTVTFTPPANTNGVFTYRYTVNGTDASLSNTAEVTVTVSTNQAPVAVDDGPVSVVSGASVAISVLANDTDVNGNLTASKNAVVVTALPTKGTVVVNNDGTVTYTANTGVSGADSFQYRAVDAGPPVPLQSNTATVTLNVKPFPSKDFTNPVPAGKMGLLTIAPGQTCSFSKCDIGSYFTMQMNPTSTVGTPLNPGPAGGIWLGQNQRALGSHPRAPSGTEVLSLDAAWSFFSNTGMHFTANGGITPVAAGVDISGDSLPDTGTLNFLNHWFVTWNDIVSINMGGGPTDSNATRGIGSISCTPAPCADNSTYALTYFAIVPPGDPSGFGGVPYGLNLTGIVKFVDSGGQALAGSLGASFIRTTSAANTPDPAMGTICIGDCVSFTVTGLAVGGDAKVAFAIAGGIPNGAVLRKFKGGAWVNFDTSGVNGSIKSAPLTTSTCPAPGGASYVAGLVSGNVCIEVTIRDGGTNDADGLANGTVVDPISVSTAAGAAPPDTRTSSDDGCSMTGADPASFNRGDWLLLAGFLGWLVWRRRTMTH